MSLMNPTTANANENDTVVESWDDVPTVVEVLPTMEQLVFGEGYASIGPDRPTRKLRPLSRKAA